MNTIISFTNSALFCLLLTSAAGACYGKEMDLMYEFQLEQLIDPSELALDTQQHRMQSMMFVNVIWTDKDGQPVVDPYTGQIVTDDDC